MVRVIHRGRDTTFSQAMRSIKSSLRKQWQKEVPDVLDKIGQTCEFGITMNVEKNQQPHSYGFWGRLTGSTGFKALKDSTMEMRTIKNMYNYRGISNRSSSPSDILKSTRNRLLRNFTHKVLKMRNAVIIGSDYTTESGYNLASIHQRGVRRTRGMIPGKKIPARRTLGFDSWMKEQSLKSAILGIRRAMLRMR